MRNFLCSVMAIMFTLDVHPFHVTIICTSLSRDNNSSLRLYQDLRH